MEQPKQMSSALPVHLGVVAFEKGSLQVVLDYSRQQLLFNQLVFRIEYSMKIDIPFNK